MSILRFARVSGLSRGQIIWLYLFALVDPIWRLPLSARRLHWRAVHPIQIFFRRFARVGYYFYAGGFCFRCVALRQGIDSGALGVRDVARMACSHMRVSVVRPEEGDA